ncbi:MAG: hypothetical protein ISS47_07210 [Candidatus Omnitrophica bacterium]|nr:hypothetical protein [Candidatus Omnitrophota bacterium]
MVLKLSFVLPFASKRDKKRDNIKPIDVCGEVRYAISGGKGLTRLGIKFLDLTEEEKGTISAFIKKNERRKAPRLSISDIFSHGDRTKNN